MSWAYASQSAPRSRPTMHMYRRMDRAAARRYRTAPGPPWVWTRPAINGNGAARAKMLWRKMSISRGTPARLSRCLVAHGSVRCQRDGRRQVADADSGHPIWPWTGTWRESRHLESSILTICALNPRNPCYCCLLNSTNQRRLVPPGGRARPDHPGSASRQFTTFFNVKCRPHSPSETSPCIVVPS